MGAEWSPPPREEAAPGGDAGSGEAVDVVVGLLAEGIEGLDGRALASRLADVERALRRLEGVAFEIIVAAEHREVFREDGHVSVRGWVKASVRLSDVEVTHRVRCARLTRRSPVWRAAMASGRLGVAQFRELARVGANRRCGDQLDEVAEAMVTVATSVSFEDFCRVVRDWERLADADGAHRDGDRAHDNRAASWRRVGDSWYLDARFAPAQGEAIAEVLNRFVEAEVTADWDQLKAVHGNDADWSLLKRSPAQRCADAIAAVCETAASAPPDASVPVPIVNYVIDAHIFDEQLAALVEDRPAVFDITDVTQVRCHSADGGSVDPADVVAAAVVGHVRRVVIGGDGVIINLGRRSRLFTGSAREAALLQAVLDRGRRCLWPGCRHRHCQVDHCHEWHDQGSTDLANAGPLCGRHNRHKSRGYRTWRDVNGNWHIRRPDGTTMPEAA